MRIVCLFTSLIFIIQTATSQPTLQQTRQGRSIIFTNQEGEHMRITAYGDQILRIQATRKNEAFFSDDHYEMVERHDWNGKLSITSEGNDYKISTGRSNGLALRLNKTSMKLSFLRNSDGISFLIDKEGIEWNAEKISTSFAYDPGEHFTGLGHGYFGRAESIDLAGKTIRRNYGTEHGQQAPLLVPYYLSSKGYGVFLNSSFPNEFNFGEHGQYGFSITGDGRMDYFIILGPEFSAIIDQYTRLTGRPRMPPKAFFGLALSDKGNDHNSTDPSDEKWWKRKIVEHRAAGFPLDHIVNDNRWRAGGGQRCVSRFEWDTGRYPDPREYAQWVKANGLIVTLDFNRCIAVQSEGWKPRFNLPQNEGIDFNTSAPDFTRKEVRDWFWNIMWTKSLNPALGYPGDACGLTNLMRWEKHPCQ
jgi:alpha-D-xyloside xylohydrolase